MWSPDEYLEQAYRNTTQRLSFNANNRREWSEWRDTLKRKFSDILAVPPNDLTELNPKILEHNELEDYIRERVEYSVDINLRVLAYLLIPKNQTKPLPTIIACHGHGYGSKELVGLQPNGKEKRLDHSYHKDFAIDLVKRGYVVLVPEVIGFGDRRLKDDLEKEVTENSCFRLATYLLMLGKTLAGQRVHEFQKGIDFLHTRQEVDASRIGCMGFSGGGQICAFAAAIDERIKAVVISGYTNTFKSSILSMRHCIDNYLPGILQYAEMPDIIGLIAPRPLFIESGKDDLLFPIEAAELAYSKINNIYQSIGKSGNLGWDSFFGEHEVNGLVSYDWLDSYL
ncbi:alpha/beta hydrolase family protein [Peribacillus alkalitolerans]|uniref:alpha/beta hydrolase family protein n=1 Tax=Peribacillus alkalitolerans TaxID=1550385 RepID=UPI0013D10F83|nr:alpha/beta hydrolase family protein [Peribacillus alkalitolerans]